MKKPGQEIVRPAQSLTGLTSDQREVNQSSLFASFSSLTKASFHSLPCSNIWQHFIHFASSFLQDNHRWLWLLFIDFYGNFLFTLLLFFCRTITADYGYFVRIDFRDFFRIEPASNEGNCDYDYLEVFPINTNYSRTKNKNAKRYKTKKKFIAQKAK